MRKLSARLIVVDPLDAHAQLSAWNTRETLARFKRLCYVMNVTGLLLHTLRTNVDPYQEVMHYAGAVDQAIHLNTDDSVQPRLLTLRSAGRGEDVNFQIQLTNEAPFAYDYAGQPKPTPEPRRRSLDEQILATIAQSRAALSARDVSNQLQRNPNSIRNSLARLLAAGRVYCSHHARGARHYRPEKVSQMNPEKSVTV
ncbi:MAG: hypothetical protein ABIV13_00255 [Fimbriimonadales bacterium]